jgi:alkanesulfonate monooxygenase SsuD/methylene tetrahydromethanopterin reductase-like flavin-dependent oxidoreductase (luciferase family)
LDIISKGRVILGVGLGYQQADFDTYGLHLRDARGRLEEGVEIIKKCWTGETFSYHGKHFQLNDVTCVPTPLQRPGPPLWFGGSADAAVRRAGRMGDGWIGTMFQNEEGARHLSDLYRSAAGGGRVALMRDAWVAGTREEAMRQYEPYWLPVIKYYWQAGLPELQHIRSESDITMDALAPPVMIIGSPEECIGQFHKWGEIAGSDYLVLRIRQEHSGGPPHDQIMGAIRRFGEEVLPHLN